MDTVTFLIIFGLSVIVSNAIFNGIERFANAVKDEFAKREDKKMIQKTVTLDEFLNKRGDFVKQVVYKIDGDYVGDIKGENVTVILMGNGDFKGDINSKNGTVFLNKGNVIGDIKADKVLCPTNKSSDKSSDITITCHSCRYYSSYGDHDYYCKKLKENFSNPYNTCSGYVERI